MVAEGYKDTEIGVIPFEWDVERLEDICINKGLRRGPFGGALKKDIFVSDGYKVYEQKNAIQKDLEIGKYFITREKYNEMEAFQIKENDFLVSCSGTIGRIVKVVSPYKEGIINQALLKITLNDKVDDDFFQFQFNSKRIQSLIIDNTQGGAMPNLVGMSIFRATKFIIPPLKEQEKIANILSTADDKIDAIAIQIDKAETLKKGLLQKLLSEGIGHSEFKDSELGKIPLSWEVDGLGKIANITKLAGYEFTEHFDYEAGGNIIALRALNVVNGKLNLNSVQRVSEEISNKLPRSKLYINDILMTYVGTLGEFAIIEEDDKFHLAPNVAKITMNSQDINISKYILYYLMSNVGQKQIKLLSTTTSQPAINMENIRKIKIPLPPLEEQKQIAKILSTADEKLEVLRAKKEKYGTLKKGLLQKLLSGEVRV